MLKVQQAREFVASARFLVNKCTLLCCQRLRYAQQLGKLCMSYHIMKGAHSDCQQRETCEVSNHMKRKVIEGKRSKKNNSKIKNYPRFEREPPAKIESAPKKFLMPCNVYGNSSVIVCKNITHVDHAK